MTNEAATATINTLELCHAFGNFASGVTVVTTQNDDGIPHGAIVSAFTALSLDPPLAQVTMTRTSRASHYLEGAPFAINILSLEQMDVALHFAGKVMAAEPELIGETVPFLTNNTATLECRPWNLYDGGDHIIVIGEVLSVKITPRPPLLLFGGMFREIGNPVEEGPWDHASEGARPGWFAGSSSFKPLTRPARSDVLAT